MTLEEMISQMEDTRVECVTCSHSELTAWLKELRDLKTKYSDVQEKIREIRGYLEAAAITLNVVGVLEALDIIKNMMKQEDGDTSCPTSDQ